MRIGSRTLAGLLLALGIVAAWPAMAGTPDSFLATAARPYDTPTLGGHSGDHWSARCQRAGEFLVGLHVRVLQSVDWVDALCETFANNRWTSSVPDFWGGSGVNRANSEGQVLCPRDTVVRGLSASRTQDADRRPVRIGLTCARPETVPASDIRVTLAPYSATPDEVGQIPVACADDPDWHYYARGVYGLDNVGIVSIGLHCDGYSSAVPAPSNNVRRHWPGIGSHMPPREDPQHGIH